MTFPGEGAAELSLINIVRDNAGLPPISEEELSRQVEVVNIGSESAKLIDLTGAVNSSSAVSPSRILVAVFSHGGVTWFFKLAGDATVVLEQKPVFLDFLQSVSFTEGALAASRPRRFVNTNAKLLPGGEAEGGPAKPAWEVPADWAGGAGGADVAGPVLKSGGSDGKAEVTVSAFPGPAGGLLDNLNRWRGQLASNR